MFRHSEQVKGFYQPSQSKIMAIKNPGIAAGVSHFVRGWMDQKSIPPIPPPGIAGAAGLSFGFSAIIASVVMRSEATEAAS